MRKLLLLLTVLCSAFVAQAQVLTISGTVTDSAGVGVPNQMVLLADSASGVYAAATTNLNGSYFWVDSIFGTTQGVIYASIFDCNGMQTIIAPYSPAALSLTVNFTNFCSGNPWIGCNFSPILSSTNPTFCNGNNGTASIIMSGGTAPYTYAWSNGQNTATITGLSMGGYDLTVTDAAGCSEVYGIFINDGCGGWGGGCGFSTNMNTTNPTICNGSDGTASISVAGGTSPYVYTWDNGQTNATATGLQMGIYSVTVTDATGCSETYSAIIGDGCGGWGGGCGFITSLITTPPNFCNGNDGTASVSVLLGGAGGFTYAWSTGHTTPTVTGLSTGVYTVTITDSSGCGEVLSLYVSDGCGGWGSCGFVPYLTSTDPTFCNGNDGTVTISVTGGTAPYTYTWANGQTNATLTGLQMGVYIVTVTDATGCSETFSTYVGDGCGGWGLPCNLNPIPSIVLPSSPTANDGSITVSINNAPTTLLFSIDWGMTWQVSNTFNNLSENFYDIIIVDTLSNCTDYLFVQLGNNFPCGVQFGYVENGLTFDFTSFVSTGANCYSWDFGDGNTSTAANPTHTFAAAGIYNVSLTICDSFCNSTYTESIYVGMVPQHPNLFGFIFKDTLIGTPADAIVYLIQHDSISGTLTVIDSTLTESGTGFFFFDSLATGNYLVKGALLPNDPDYANYLPTYFVNALSWTNAFYVDVQPNYPAFAYVQLVQGNNPGGAGFIGGLIVNGAGRPFNGVVTLVEDVTNMDPIVGASVLLLDGNSNAVTHTTTDENGAYAFAGVGMGDYKVHVEMLGKIIYEAELTVDAANLDHTGVHFTVHSSMVTLTGTESVQFIDGVNVFPNPVTDVANVQVKLKETADVTVVLTNLVGQQVLTQNQRLNAGQNNFNLEMNNLPSGLYFLTFRSGSEVVTYKVQKQ